MGLSFSRQTLPEENVFANELIKINKIINGILNSNNIYSNSEYNFFLKKQCSDFVIVNEKKLYKYKKHELSNLENYLMIPKTELVSTKKTFCHNISMYYTRILQIIHCIKYIYDIENNGDNSIGGIVFRNIKANSDIVKVEVCESAQNDIKHFEKGVNFSMLSGFDIFVKYILSEEEAKVFIRQLSVILDGYDKRKLQRLICNDVLINVDEHSSLHKYKFDKCTYNTNKRQQSGGTTPSVLENNLNSDIFIKVKEQNPIFNWNLCGFRKTYIAKNLKQLDSLIVQMKKNYKNNFNDIIKILYDLVYFDTGKNQYVLKNVRYDAIQNIEYELKRCIITFFMQSLSDYKNILNTIKPYSIINNE